MSDTDSAGTSAVDSEKRSVADPVVTDLTAPAPVHATKK